MNDKQRRDAFLKQVAKVKQRTIKKQPKQQPKKKP